MKRKILAIFISVAVLHLLLLLGIGMSGGCRTQKVLRNRTYIPALNKPVESVDSTVAESIPELESPILPPVLEITPDDFAKGAAITETVVEDLPPLPEVKSSPITYTVQKGDSFWKIGRSYGVSMRELAAYNKLSLNKPLKAGTKLTIPPGGQLLKKDIDKALNQALSENKTDLAPLKLEAPKKLDATPSPTTAKAEDGIYVVKKGDSLWKIAIAYNLRTKTLAEANNLDMKKPLKVGQNLIIPGGKSKVGSSSENTKSAQTTPPASQPSAPPKTESAKPVEPPQPVEEVVTKKEIEEFKLGEISSEVIEEITNSDKDGALDDAVNSLLEGNTSTSYGEHHVLTGDTWESIARQYGLTVEKLRQANPPLAEELKEGTIVKIPTN